MAPGSLDTRSWVRAEAASGRVGGRKRRAARVTAQIGGTDEGKTRYLLQNRLRTQLAASISV